MIKKLALILAIPVMFYACNNNSSSTTNNSESSETKKTEAETPKALVANLTSDEFKSLIYDYEKNPNEWVFKGTKPVVIDFYADWCRPCKTIAPILEELAQEYSGKVNFYRVNIDNEAELAQAFNITSIPVVIFSGTKGKPQGTMGAYPKEEYKKYIDSVLAK